MMSSSSTSTLDMRGWLGLMYAAGFLSIKDLLACCPTAESLEMWRWVEMLASSMWLVMPGPTDLSLSGRDILLLLSPSSMLVVYGEESLLVQNTCRGFSLDTCFRSDFTFDLCSL